MRPKRRRQRPTKGPAIPVRIRRRRLKGGLNWSQCCYIVGGRGLAAARQRRNAMSCRSTVFFLAGSFFFARASFGQRVAQRPAAAPAARPSALAQKPATVLPPEKQGQWQGGV